MNPPTQNHDPEYAVTNKNQNSFLARRVRVAATSASRRRGLLGVDLLDQESGLWIVPCEVIHTFGMSTAIDAIFLDKSGRVRKLKPNLVASRIAVCFSARSVLELAPGAIERSNTQLGDLLLFSPQLALAEK